MINNRSHLNCSSMTTVFKEKQPRDGLLWSCKCLKEGWGHQLLKVVSKEQAKPEQSVLLLALQGTAWLGISPRGKMGCFHIILKLIIIN